MHLLAAQSAALVEANVEFVSVAAGAINVDAVGVVNVARAVDEPVKGAIEVDDHLHVLIRALGGDICGNS